MGTTRKCDGCDQTFRYRRDEIHVSGTAWHRVFTIHCKNCGKSIVWSFSNKILQDEPYKGKGGRQRALESDIKEYWIQQYFVKKFRRYGFERVRGPFPTGPDFSGVYLGEKMDIEVERDCRGYVNHRHHLDNRFEKTCALVVLNPKEPSVQTRKNLPKYIVYLQVDDFVRFWEPRAKRYAMRKRFEERLMLFSGELQRRYPDVCTDTLRDLASCPECDLCAYGPSGIVFDKMALKLVAVKKYNILSDGFRFSRIKPATIDKFFLQYFRYLDACE